MRILIVEDEKKLSEALAAILQKNKYSADAAYDGVDGLDCAMSGIYDVIILDIMLPRMDGLELLRRLRADGIKTPVILLTAKYEITDRVRGLDSGADDYLTKPFSSDELLARIRALSRRNVTVFGDDALTFDDITLDLSAYELCCGGRNIRLGAKEMQILELLIKYGGRICSKEELLVKVWGYDSDAEYNNVEVYISFIRKKLTHLHSRVQIKTVRSAGYCLAAEV
ncbi:MAG: response regulator transcription factor [Eubacteriales bacterium]